MTEKEFSADSLGSRRHFLLSTAAALTMPSLAAAIDPIQRAHGPKFKFSLAAYSYRSLLSGKAPQLSFVDFLDDCAKMQLDAAELTSYYFPQDVTLDYFRKMKHEAFVRGLDISGTAVGNDFCWPPGERRKREIESVKKWITFADAMDAPVIRIFAGKQKSGQTIEEAEKLVVAGIEECCDYSGKYGVFLALENHGGITSEAEGMLRMVRAVQSPWFGVNVDTGNFHTEDVYGDLAKIAPYALNVQVKVVIRPANGQTQPADYQRLAKILREVSYRGYVVLEYEEQGNPRTECPKHLAEMRAGFSGGA